jgi:hypothetical protein
MNNTKLILNVKLVKHNKMNLELVHVHDIILNAGDGEYDNMFIITNNNWFISTSDKFIFLPHSNNFLIPRKFSKNREIVVSFENDDDRKHVLKSFYNALISWSNDSFFRLNDFDLDFDVKPRIDFNNDTWLIY